MAEGPWKGRRRGMVTFKVLLEKGEDGYWVVTVPSLPGCVSQGRTKKEALANVREAIELHVSALAEDGEPLRLREGVEEAKVSVGF
jgi:predicted RNase H-like HicB family nuclease